MDWRRCNRYDWVHSLRVPGKLVPPHSDHHTHPDLHPDIKALHQFYDRSHYLSRHKFRLLPDGSESPWRQYRRNRSRLGTLPDQSRNNRPRRHRHKPAHNHYH